MSDEATKKVMRAFARAFDADLMSLDEFAEVLDIWRGIGRRRRNGGMMKCGCWAYVPVGSANGNHFHCPVHGHVPMEEANVQEPVLHRYATEQPWVLYAHEPEPSPGDAKVVDR